MKKIILISFIFIAVKSFAQQPCSDLFISEYIEGTSFNKAIEIFNPTTNVIDLSFYELRLFSNGSATPTSTYTLSGMLNPNDVYVVANPQADPAILAVADATSGVINFNGDDAFQLNDPFAGFAVDVIGEIGVQPTGSWPVDTGTTANHTLVRKDIIQLGDTVWTTGATGWDAYGVNDFSHLGSHTFISCLVSQDPDLYFTLQNYSANENAGTLTFSVGITNSNSASTSVDVSLASGGTATSGQDFTFSPATITFAPFAVSPQNFTVTIIDDALLESTENFTLNLSNATNNATISGSSLAISILDNDASVVNPTVKFDSILLSYNENAGNIQLSVSLSHPNSSATTVDLGLNAPGTTATPVQDFSFTASTLTFPANDSTPQVVSVPIIDDATNEPTENISFKLSNPTNSATISGSNIKTVSIIDNDPNGVVNLKPTGFYFYPNPAHDVLHLTNAGGVGKAEISNLMGQVIKTFNTGGIPSSDLDVNDLAAGMYFLNIYSVSGVKTYKLRIN